MTVALSSADVARLRATIRTFVAPFTYDSIEDWRTACRAAIEPLVGVERSGFILPVVGGPLISCGPELLEPAVAWEQYYHTVDIGMAQRRNDRGLTVFHALDLYEERELQRTELYGDWLRPYRLEDALAMALDIGDGLPPASVHCYGDGTNSELRDRGRALLDIVFPAFEAGALAAIRYAGQRGAWTDFFDEGPEGIRMLDVQGRCLHQTSTLSRLLADPSAASALEQAVSEVGTLTASLLTHRSKSASADLPRSFRRTMQVGSRTYAVRGTLLQGVVGGGDPVIVVAVDAPTKQALTDEQLRARFGLTAREIAVARELAARHGSKEIAASLGISIHTVRRHIERVYAKLGVNTRIAVGARVAGE